MKKANFCDNCNSSEMIVYLSKEFSNKSKHIEIRCEGCGKFFGYKKREVASDVERSKAFVMPIGKYKGLTMAEIAAKDMDYIYWIIANVDKSAILTAAKDVYSLTHK